MPTLPRDSDVTFAAVPIEVIEHGLALSNGDKAATLSSQPNCESFGLNILSKSGATSDGECPSSKEDRAEMDLNKPGVGDNTWWVRLAC